MAGEGVASPYASFRGPAGPRRRLIRAVGPLDVSFFDAAYDGSPPWDIGRPQGEVTRLEDAGEIRGRVLDVGCGTGENALFMAGRGHPTWGVDSSPKAIERARRKLRPGGPSVRFELADALRLSSLGEPFDTVLDCGLFHSLDDPERPVYAASIAATLRPGGCLFILCFSELEPKDWGGPRRVTQDDLRSTFGTVLRERWIRPARFETTNPSIGGRGWLASFGLRSTADGR